MTACQAPSRCYPFLRTGRPRCVEVIASAVAARDAGLVAAILLVVVIVIINVLLVVVIIVIVNVSSGDATAHLVCLERL